MKQPIMIVSSILIVISLLLSACSGGKTSNSPSTSVKPTTELKSYANDPSELVVYGSPGGGIEVWNERYGDALTKKFPNYKITYIQRNANNTPENFIATGAQVDIILDSVGNAVNSVVATDYAFDLTELIKKHGVDLNRFEPATIEAVKQFGGMYGFPVENGGLVLYYNKDIFDKFGVAYPKDGMTWEEAIELGNRVTRVDNGRQYIGLAASLIHVLRMNSYSLPFTDKATEKAAFNTDKYKKFVETVAIAPSLAPGYKEKVAALKRTFANDDFGIDRSIAMFVMNFGLQSNKEFETFNWDMVSVPVFKENPGVGSQPYPGFMFITKTSKYKDQAMEVLKYLTSDEFQLAFSKKGYIPVLKDESIKKVFAQESKFKDKNLMKAIFTNKFASPISQSKLDAKVHGPLTGHITRVILGSEDLNTAFRSAEEESNKAIEADKAKK